MTPAQQALLNSIHNNDFASVKKLMSSESNLLPFPKYALAFSALSKCSSELLDYLAEHGLQQTVLEYYINSENFNKAKILLKAGVTLNANIITLPMRCTNNAAEFLIQNNLYIDTLIEMAFEKNELHKIKSWIEKQLISIDKLSEVIKEGDFETIPTDILDYLVTQDLDLDIAIPFYLINNNIDTVLQLVDKHKLTKLNIQSVYVKQLSEDTFEQLKLRELLPKELLLQKLLLGKQFQEEKQLFTTQQNIPTNLLRPLCHDKSRTLENLAMLQELRNSYITILMPYSGGDWSPAFLNESFYPKNYILVTVNDTSYNTDFSTYKIHGIELPGGGGTKYSSGNSTLAEIGFENLLDYEKVYHHLINLAKKLYMPTLGECAGHHQIALAAGGAVVGVETSSTLASLIPGTYLHYLAMTEDEKQVAKLTCHFPKITIDVNRAHRFGVSLDNHGDVGIMSISEDGVIMSIQDQTSPNIIGVQFHPSLLTSDSRQKNILDGIHKSRADYYNLVEEYGYGHEATKSYINNIMSDLAMCGCQKDFDFNHFLI